MSLKNLSALQQFDTAMQSKTEVVVEAQAKTYWLRFKITALAMICALFNDIAEVVGETVKILGDATPQSLKDLLDDLKGAGTSIENHDLYVSFPLNPISGGMYLPNTGKGMILSGAPTKDEGGDVVVYDAKLSAFGVEKFFRTQAARDAAAVLEAEMSAEMHCEVRIGLEDRIVHQRIQRANREQRDDAREQRQEQNNRRFRQPQRGGSGRSEEPGFSGASSEKGGTKPPIAGL